MASNSPFNAPNIDMVPYDIDILDASGNVIPDTSTGILALVSGSASAIVVPNSTDPTGATGNVVAAAGFSGAVGGTATYVDASAVPPVSLSGTWSGTFTPDQPASISVVFSSPTAAVAAAKSASARR
jgi:hypothetical protein